MLGTYSPGDQADDALSLGYGSHGRLGEDEIESGPSDLLGFFGVCDCDDAGPTLLGLLSPDVPDGEREDTYDDDWDAKVYAPGGEDDPA